MIFNNINIGKEFPPFIIAEMSGNHNQSLDRALQIVDSAASSGVNAIKLQTYTADTITIDKKGGEFEITDPDSLWYGHSLYELYNEAHTPWEWHEPIMDRARKQNLICFSAPFDLTAVEFLENLNVPMYKISSFEIVDHALVKRVAETGKPIIISTGMASIQEIANVVDIVRKTGNDNIVLLKCTSNYPATPTNSNLLTIPHMRSLFGCEIGLSDHTMGIGAAIVALSLGATIIEKHFTLNRQDGGVDAAFSLEPNEMTSLVIESKRAWQSLGNIKYGPTMSEKASMQFRRSLYVVQDIKKGEIIDQSNVRSIRPGYGLDPKYLEFILNKSVNCDLLRGTPFSWDYL